jgi:hypothetical protein
MCGECYVPVTRENLEMCSDNQCCVRWCDDKLETNVLVVCLRFQVLLCAIYWTIVYEIYVFMLTFKLFFVVFYND